MEKKSFGTPSVPIFSKIGLYPPETSMRFALALPFLAVGGLCAADPVVAPSTATIKIRYNNATIVSSISASVGNIWMPPRTRSQFGYSYNGSTKADGVMRLTGGTIVGQDLVKLVPVYSSGVSTPITMIPGGEYAPVCGRQEFTSTNLVGFMDWWIAETTTRTGMRIKLDASGNPMRDSIGNFIYESYTVTVPTGRIIKKTHGTACAANFAGMLTPTITSTSPATGKWTVKFGYTATWPSYITYPVYAENNIVKNGSSIVTPVGLPTSFSSGTKINVFSVTTNLGTEVSWSIAGKTVKFQNGKVTYIN